jgi:outer membrane lipoprotein LolB
MKYSHFLRCAAFALTLPLTACITTQAVHPPTTGTGTGAALPHNYYDNIDISGRFSVQFEHNGRPESWSGSFTWAQTPDKTTVALLSPLGQTLATIVSDEQMATMIQSGQEPRRAANVDALVQETLGWPLPISHLRDWLQAYTVNANGQRIPETPTSSPIIATADGWNLNFVSWQDNNDFSIQNMPKRIDLERETAEAGKVAMRLVITSSQVH